MMLGWAVGLALVGLGASDHPATMLTSWIGSSHVWYRNGNQPWWVEEDLFGDWHETWYEESMDKVNRVVYLRDWNRGLTAVIDSESVVVRKADSDVSESEESGRWGKITWRQRSGGQILTTTDGVTWEVPNGASFVLDQDRSSDKSVTLVSESGEEIRISDQGDSSKHGRGAFEVEEDHEERFRDVQPDEIINPGKRIGMITLNTPNIANWAVYGEVNQKHYARKYGYTLYIYRHSILPRHIVTWNKVIAIPRHLKDHDYLMWIDSDAIVTNMDIKIEDVIAKAPTKNFLACGDIGGWLLNTGVMIFKNSDWAFNLLRDLWEKMPHYGHDRAAEQNQLIQLLRQQDNNRVGWHLFDECEFNCHPRHHKAGMYIMHMMGDSGPNRIETFTEWNKRLGVALPEHDEL